MYSTLVLGWRAASLCRLALLSFYDGTAESLTVSCTATLTAPDGTSLSVSAKAPQITVLKPTASWGVDPKTMPVFSFSN